MKIGINKILFSSSFNGSPTFFTRLISFFFISPKNLADKFILFFFILVIIGIQTDLHAQEYTYVHYEVKDGLAGSTVYCMVQDKDGFIWFGTETGLSRFDGTHFKNFTTADGLPDNEIIKLFIDSKNRIWIVPFKNSLCYYWNGKIYTAQNDSLLKKITLEYEIQSIVENKDGDLLIQETKASHIIDHSGELYRINTLAGHPFHVLKSGLNNDRDFRVALIIDSSFDLTFADIRKNTMTVSEILINHGSQNYGSIYLKPGLQIYVSHNKLHFVYPNEEWQSNIPFSEGFIDISGINDTTIAINFVDKTLLFDVVHKKLVDRFSIEQPINTVIQDNEGSLWFSTMGKGVYRLSSSDFENYSFKTNGNNSSVFCIRKFDSITYIGTDNFYLWALNPDFSFKKNKQIARGYTRGRIISIDKINNKRLLLGNDYGLFAVDDWKVTTLLTEMSIKDISFDVDDKLIVSTNNKVIRYDPLKLTIADTVWSERATCAFKTSGNIYIGTLNGLYAVDQDKRSFFLGDSNKLLKNRIAALERSPDGTLWIATSGNGVIGYRNGKVVRNITTKEGLTSNICRNIFISDHDMWVGTDKGLNKIDMADTLQRIKTFTTGDGLKSDIINAVYVDKNEVLCGTSEGMTRFDVNKIARRSSCRLYITDIIVSEKSMPNTQTEFTLAHKDNNMRIDFVGISYKSAGDIIYKYKLSNVDSIWKTTRETSLNYPSLPSGNYEMELAAINKFEIESNHILIRFTVEKLLREKVWFQIAIFFLLIALVSFFVYLRIKNLKQKEAQKTMLAAKLGELEQMALRSQMNPHFIFNSLNSIQQYVIDKDILGANEFITQFSRLIRLTLDLSTKLDISLEQELIYLSTYLELEKKRFENKFTYEINIDARINKEDFFIPPMILQPYIENSIRHGMRYKKDADGKILIRFVIDSKYLVCSIEDNGIGRQQTLQFKSLVPIEYQSKGMTLTARRIEVFNNTHVASILINIEDLEDQNHKPMGTKVIIDFPLQEVYRPNNLS